MTAWNAQPDPAPAGRIILPGGTPPPSGAAPPLQAAAAPAASHYGEDFAPAVPLWEWGGGDAFTLADATTGVAVFGATGSGKTSGPARMLAAAYLAMDFGGIVLCAKPEERRQWEEWAEAAERWDRRTQTGDLVILDKRALRRFNFLDWEASRAGDGGGLTMNVVALLNEVISSLNRGKEGGGGEDSGFWKDALEQLITAAVDLVIMSGEPLTLALLRDVVRSAPNTPQEASSPEWQAKSKLWGLVEKANARLSEQSDDERGADLDECINYWLIDFPGLAEKTRGIIVLSFTSLARPFTAQPLRQLFSTTTNVRPEDTFSGKIIIVDLPVQEYRQAGRVAALVVKYCWQIAVLRRQRPPSGQFLRPVFLWADEAQNFMGEFDEAFQAVARSAGGCTVYLAQNINQYRRQLGNDDAFEAFIGNLQTKIFCQNTGETNTWASELLGKRWKAMESVSKGVSGAKENVGSSSNTSFSLQLVALVEPNEFTTLARGGAPYEFTVEAIAFKGGQIFNSTGQNMRRLEIDQMA